MRSLISHRRRLLLAGVAALALGGCSGLPEINVEKQWGDAMRRLNMTAIYPPSEDIQIGDVFLFVPPASGPFRFAFQDDAASPRFSFVRLGATPVDTLSRMLRTEEAGRLRIRPWPETKLGTQPPGEDASKSTAPKTVTPAGRTDPTRTAPPSPPSSYLEVGNSLEGPAGIRLRRVAIPALTVARLTEGQISGQVPFQWVTAQLGIGNAKSVALTVNVKKAEIHGVEGPRALSAVTSALPGWVATHLPPRHLIRLVADLNPSIGTALCRGDIAAFEALDQPPQILIANQVVYSHEIEYAFGTRNTTAVQALANLSRGLPTPANAGSLPSIAVVAPEAAGANAKAASETEAKVLASSDPLNTIERVRLLEQARARGMLEALAGASFPNAGVGATLAIGSTGQLSLHDTFSRPMAVAVGAPVLFDLVAGLMAFPPPPDYRWIPGGSDQQHIDAHVSDAVLECASLLGKDFSAGVTNELLREAGAVAGLICGNMRAQDARANAVGLTRPLLPTACTQQGALQAAGAGAVRSAGSRTSSASRLPASVSIR